MLLLQPYLTIYYFITLIYYPYLLPGTVSSEKDKPVTLLNARIFVDEQIIYMGPGQRAII